MDGPTGHRLSSTFVAAEPKAALGPLLPAPNTALTNRRLVTLLVIGTIALVVLPEVITHLNLKHSPDLPPLEDEAAASKFPLSHLVSLAGSATLLLVSAVIAVRRGHPHRQLNGLFILLLAVNLPYLISPVTPGPSDLIKVVLANTMVLALWNAGASVTELKWLPIIVSGIGVYSLIGGFLIPDYMMYNLISEKALVGGWELAGPFGHGNVLGMYCAVAFSLIPLVERPPWRMVCAVILCATVVASASRTAVIATLMVLLWWAVTAFRSTISVRLAGTVGAAVSAAAMVVIPFLPWDPRAFTERAAIWAASIDVWHHSPILGSGVNWFMTDAQATGNIAAWAYVGTGHNIVMDTLVKSGLLGALVLAPVVVGAIFAVRALRARSQQIAFFGFLMAFFVAATTEAVWALLPNLQLFPISGLIFAMLILNRYRTDEEVP
jgi:O-antigen ligase